MKPRWALLLQRNNGSSLTIRQMARAAASCLDSSESCPPPQLFQSTTYVNSVAWGQVPRFRLIVAISPLVIMIATIVIILTSLNNAKHLDLDHIASFNAMDALYIIAACSLGNVNTVSFPGYSKNIGLFSKDVEVELTEIEVGKGAAGFRLSSRWCHTVGRIHDVLRHPLWRHAVSASLHIDTSNGEVGEDRAP